MAFRYPLWLSDTRLHNLICRRHESVLGRVLREMNELNVKNRCERMKDEVV